MCATQFSIHLLNKALVVIRRFMWCMFVRPVLWSVVNSGLRRTWRSSQGRCQTTSQTSRTNWAASPTHVLTRFVMVGRESITTQTYNTVHRHWRTKVKVKVWVLAIALLPWEDSWTAVLYYLGIDSWLTWAIGTAAYYAAIQCPWQQTVRPMVQHDRYTITQDISHPNQPH